MTSIADVPASPVPGSRPSGRRGGIWLAAAGAILFSAKSIVVKLAYHYPVDAEALLTLRMVLSMPFFAGALWWSAARDRTAGIALTRLSRRDYGLIALAGLLGYYAASLFDFMGLQYVSAGLERLILFTYPPIVLLISCALRRRWPGTRATVAMLVSYLGLMIVYSHEIRLEGPRVTLGALLVLGSSISYAAYLVLAGSLLERLGTIRVTALATLVSGAAILLQYSLHQSWSALLQQNAAVWGLSLINAVFCTVLPVFMVMMAIARIGPSRVSQIAMLGPVATIGMGTLILGEHFTPYHLCGTSLVLIGVALLSQRSGTKWRWSGSQQVSASR